MLTVARLTQPDFVRIATVNGVPQFLSIPFSHYCEFSRWCLQYGNIKFEEQAYVPLQHVLPTLSVRVGGAKKHISTSSVMTKPGEENKPKKGVTTVPLLVLQDGSVLRDSWEIAATTSLTPPTLEMKKLLDEEAGPLARQMAYLYLLRVSAVPLFSQFWLYHTGILWKILWFLGLKYIALHLMRGMVKFEDPTSMATCQAKLGAVFAKLETALDQKTTPYFGGAQLGVTDIAMCSLLGPVLMADEYCLGNFKYINDQALQDEEYAENLRKWRDTKVGKYCMDIFKNHRTATL